MVTAYAGWMRQTRRSAKDDACLKCSLAPLVYHEDDGCPLLPSEGLLEAGMITDEALRQHVYRSILKMANKRFGAGDRGFLGGCVRTSVAGCIAESSLSHARRMGVNRRLCHDAASSSSNGRR